MDRLQRMQSKKGVAHGQVHTKEAGFTYIELVITLALIMLFLPVIFALYQFFVSNVQEITGKGKLQQEYMSFYSLIQHELRQGEKFLAGEGYLTFTLPNGERVRYEKQDSSLIRRVAQTGRPFKGYTVLLQYLDSISYQVRAKGVEIKLSMKNGPSKFRGIQFFASRMTANEE